MNKTFLICCTEKTAEELREKGISFDNGLTVVNNHEDLVKQIKLRCDTSIILEDIHKDAKIGEEEHITEIAQRIIKLRSSASIIILQEEYRPFHPNLFKGSLSQEGLRTMIKN